MRGLHHRADKQRNQHEYRSPHQQIDDAALPIEFVTSQRAACENKTGYKVYNIQSVKLVHAVNSNPSNPTWTFAGNSAAKVA